MYSQHSLTKLRPGVRAFKNVKPLVTVVNDVDNDAFPSDFVYVDRLVHSADVPEPDPEFLVGCQDCDNRCRHKSFEGASDSVCHEYSSYNRNGLVTIAPGASITECNLQCKCGPECFNRVVQRGRKIPLQIFKTKEKGWGVQAMADIKCGKFVEEYTGEVIGNVEGESRGQIYDLLGYSYLFDMDYAEDNETPAKYTIDSYVLGNASHFFNHSCTPNLGVYAVFYDSAAPDYHRIAFFAVRDIKKGEELTFDYIGDRASELQEPDGTVKKPKKTGKFPCRCGSAVCRKWIYL